MERHKLVVIDENTLGCINPLQPTIAQILHASVLRGANYQDLDGIMPIAYQDLNGILIACRQVRPATKEDFETYRVCPKGFLDNPHYEWAQTPA